MYGIKASGYAFLVRLTSQMRALPAVPVTELFIITIEQNLSTRLGKVILIGAIRNGAVTAKSKL